MPKSIILYNSLKESLITRREAYTAYILHPTGFRTHDVRGRLISHLMTIAKPDEDMKPAIDFHVPNLMRRVDLLFLEYCDEYRLYA